MRLSSEGGLVIVDVQPVLVTTSRSHVFFIRRYLFQTISNNLVQIVSIEI